MADVARPSGVASGSAASASGGPAQATGVLAEAPRPSASARNRLVRSLRHNPSAIFGLLIVVGVVLMAVFAPLIAPRDPNAQAVAVRNTAPFSGREGVGMLGTDSLGRDLLSRIIYGSQVSLFVGIAAVVVQGAIGITLGLLAGYYHGRVDAVIMRVADIELAVPFLILAIAIAAVLGPGLQNIVIVLGVTGWVIYSRVVRGEVLSVGSREFVEAARCSGAGDPRIIARHILPNVTASLIVIATLQVARMIISEASLSFLGMGVPLSIPTWGGMVAAGRNEVFNAWWISTLPGIALLFTVLGINLVGDWLRDYLDPRIRD